VLLVELWSRFILLVVRYIRFLKDCTRHHKLDLLVGLVELDIVRVLRDSILEILTFSERLRFDARDEVDETSTMVSSSETSISPLFPLRRLSVELEVMSE
jgi:hypothetical protein